jgi:hypothetical protein
MKCTSWLGTKGTLTQFADKGEQDAADGLKVHPDEEPLTVTNHLFLG